MISRQTLSVKTGNVAFSIVYCRGFAEGLVVVENVSSKMFARLLYNYSPAEYVVATLPLKIGSFIRIVMKFDQLANHVVGKTTR